MAENSTMKKIQHNLRSGFKRLKSKLRSRPQASTSATCPASDPATPPSPRQAHEHDDQNEHGISVPQIGHLEVNQPLETQPAPALKAQAQSPRVDEDRAPDPGSAAGDGNDPPEEKADCWTLALRRLNEESRNIIQEVCTKEVTDDDPKNSNTVAWAQLLLGEIRILQDKYQAEKGDMTFRFAGRTFRIRTILDGLSTTLLKVMDTFGKAAELATSVAPAYAVGPFLLVKTLLFVRIHDFLLDIIWG